MANFNFNIQEVDQNELSSNDFQPIPDGWYRAEIVESRIEKTNKSKQANDNKNQYLELTWRILDGQYARRVVWDIINVINENSETVRIGKQDLAKRCIGLGVDSFSNSSSLHNRPCMIKVTTRPASNGFDAKNKVSATRRDDSAPSESAPVQSQGQPPRGAPPPWETFSNQGR